MIYLESFSFWVDCTFKSLSSKCFFFLVAAGLWKTPVWISFLCCCFCSLHWIFQSAADRQAITARLAGLARGLSADLESSASILNAPSSHCLFDSQLLSSCSNYSFDNLWIMEFHILSPCLVYMHFDIYSMAGPKPDLILSSVCE